MVLWVTVFQSLKLEKDLELEVSVRLLLPAGYVLRSILDVIVYSSNIAHGPWYWDNKNQNSSNLKFS